MLHLVFVTVDTHCRLMSRDDCGWTLERCFAAVYHCVCWMQMLSLEHYTASVPLAMPTVYELISQVCLGSTSVVALSVRT